LGGLSVAAREAMRVLDAVGFPWVLIETVGVGQVEVEVAGAADTTVVVLNPGWGDAVQASKAGLLEIADVFAINKADRAGVDDARRDLENMLDLGAPLDDPWRPPIIPVVATDGVGVDELWSAVLSHREWLSDNGRLERKRRERLVEELHGLLVARLLERARSAGDSVDFDRLQDEVVARTLDPWSAVDALLDAADG
jgi:LAO/AO transport system kinase